MRRFASIFVTVFTTFTVVLSAFGVVTGQEITMVLTLAEDRTEAVHIPFGYYGAFKTWEDCANSDGDWGYYTPKSWPTAADWSNVGNWISYPIMVDIPYIDDWDGDDGTQAWVDEHCKWQSASVDAETFARIFGNPAGYIPAYSEPVWKAYTKNCEKKNGGHEWSSCACKKCGTARAHSLAADEDDPTKCDWCHNYNGREYEYGTGEAVTHTSSYYCRCRGLMGGETVASSIDHHHGWHDTDDIDGNDYICSCTCGDYNMAHLVDDDSISDDAWEEGAWRLNYNTMTGYIDEESKSDWHHAYSTCARDKGNGEKCGSKHYVNQGHKYGTDTKYYPIKWDEATGDWMQCEIGDPDVNTESHLLVGECTKCHYKNMTLALHQRSADKCVCEKCGVAAHEWQAVDCKGRADEDRDNENAYVRFHNLICINCKLFPTASQLTYEWARENGVPESMLDVDATGTLAYHQHHMYGINEHNVGQHKCFCGYTWADHEAADGGKLTTDNRCRWCGYPDGVQDADGKDKSKKERTYTANGRTDAGGISFSSFDIGSPSSGDFPSAPDLNAGGYSTVDAISNAISSKYSTWKLKRISYGTARHWFNYFTSWLTVTYRYVKDEGTDNERTINVFIDTSYFSDTALLKLCQMF